MAPKQDQFSFRDKFSTFVRNNNDAEADSDYEDEYDTEANLTGRLGGLGIPHDDDLDVPHNTGGRGGKSLGGLGGLGGRSIGGLGGLGGGRTGMMSRGASTSAQGSGLGGLGRGRTSQLSKNANLENVSSSDNQRLSKSVGLLRGETLIQLPSQLVSTDVTKDSNEGMSKALGDIAKGTTAMQKEVAAFISDSQKKNVEAFNQILHFLHGLQDKTVLHFKELSRVGASNISADEVHQPVDEALQALINNIDKTLKDKNTDTAYIMLPNNSSVDTSELSKLLGTNDVQIVDRVRSLCDKIMSKPANIHVPESEDTTTAVDKPTTSLPVQVTNITPASSPSKGLPPLRSPMK